MSEDLRKLAQELRKAAAEEAQSTPEKRATLLVALAGLETLKNKLGLK